MIKISKMLNTFITKTRLYNFDPLKPHFYIVKLGFTGVYIIFIIFAQKHRVWVLVFFFLFLFFFCFCFFCFLFFLLLFVCYCFFFFFLFLFVVVFFFFVVVFFSRTNFIDAISNIG